MQVVIIGIIAVASLGSALFLYDYLMPAWIYVERSGSNSEAPVAITEEDIARHQILQSLILKADKSYGIVPSNAIEMVSKTETREIENLLAINDETNDQRGNFMCDDKRYYIHVFYQYSPPHIAVT